VKIKLRKDMYCIHFFIQYWKNPEHLPSTKFERCVESSLPTEHTKSFTTMDAIQLAFWFLLPS
jgi:hypothetical protein